MSKNDIIVEYTDFKEIRIDPLKSRFRKLATEYFEFDLTNKKSKNLIKEISKFASLHLPAEIDEVFINLNTAPFFLAAQTPLLQQLEKFLIKSLSTVGGLDDHREIKEYYSKWLNAQLSDNKRYFAIQAIKLTEQNISKYNFFNPLLSAVILTFDETLFNPGRAIELFSEAKDILGKLKINDESRIHMLYLVELYIGFVSLKLKDFENARTIFQYALNLKPDGITAVFYISYSELMLENYLESVELLQKIWKYDLDRINYTIDQNNFIMFNYVIENSVFPNIFYYDDFTSVHENIQTIIDLSKDEDELIIESLKKRVSSFLILKYENPSADSLIKNIIFVDKVIASFAERKNIYFLAILRILQNKFDSAVKQIIDSIQARHEKNILEQVKIYEDQMDEKRIEIEKMESYLEEIKKDINERKTENIKFLEGKYNSEIAELQNKVKNINELAELNPLDSFSNTMSYNFFLSFVVFTVGLFSTYLNSNYGNDITQILSGGFKWGLICYVTGSFIATIIAGKVGMERAYTRQRFIKNIHGLKRYREQELERIREYAEKEEEYAVQKINRKKITQLKKQIDNIQKEKKQHEEILKKEAEEKIKEETEIFQDMLI